MGITIIRAGQTRHVMVGDGVDIREASADSTTPWYLSGGISAAACVAAYKSIGAASFAASLTPVNTASHVLTDPFPGFVLWSALRGWYSNGGATGLISDILPNANWSFMLRIANAGVERDSIFGEFTPVSWMFANLTTMYNGWDPAVAHAGANGTIGMAGVRGFVNGAYIGDCGVWAGGIATQTLAFFGRSGQWNSSDVDIPAGVIHNIQNSDMQMGLLHTAMMALI